MVSLTTSLTSIGTFSRLVFFASVQTRRITSLDLFAKHHFILNGLGWGGMPLHAVRKDLEEGRLKPLSIEDVPPGGLDVPMSAVWQTKSPPGPAGRWFIDRLRDIPVSSSAAPKLRAAAAGQHKRR